MLVGSISAHDSYSSGFDIIGITNPTDVVIEEGVDSNTNNDTNNKCTWEYMGIDNTLSIRCHTLTSGIRITATGVKNTF